jgi:hypothetical protein
LANVKPARAYDPFPREGLVKAFEPFIRKEVEEYCKQYRHVPGTDMLIEAVRLATLAEARFKPALGNSFSTFVHYRLKELHRFAENHSGGQSVPYETAAARALREAAEAGGPIEPMQLGGGSTPMLFDWQWMRSLLKRQRIVFGFRGHGGMNVHRLADRLQELRGIPWGRPPDAAVFAAAADHLFRRQREEDDETEKRKLGDHSPTFLEAEPVTSLQFPTPRQPPLLMPERVAHVSLDTGGAGLDEDGNRISLHEMLAAPSPALAPEIDPLKQINTGRAFMSRVENIAADVAVEAIRGKPYSLSSLADRLGMTKSGASKVWDRIIDKVRKE